MRWRKARRDRSKSSPCSMGKDEEKSTENGVEPKTQPTSIARCQLWNRGDRQGQISQKLTSGPRHRTVRPAHNF